MSALAPSTAKAGTSCKDVVKACDKALADQDQVIKHKTYEITEQKKVIAAQDTRIVELEKKNSSLFRSPWLYLGLGLITGVLIAK